MISTDNLCMSCMREIGDEKKCPHCGYYRDSAQISPFLPVRTVISNRYLVGKILEYNGEGATYIGWDLSERKPVKIREFIPDSLSARTPSDLNLKIAPGGESAFAELRQSFEELWTKLARLRGLPSLINVTAVVEDYGTSYAIYDHYESVSLKDFLLRSKTGYLEWNKAKQLLLPLLSTIGTLHSSGIIHRGISPMTIVIERDGKLKLTGFSIGAARTARSELNSQLFDGYAAIEQYGLDARQGAWTDIYAFAAVLYRVLIGTDPISAKERMNDDRLVIPGKFAEIIPQNVINSLINALQILPEDRTKTVEQLRFELMKAQPVPQKTENLRQNEPPQVEPQEKAVEEKKKEKSGGNASFVLKTALICFAAGLIVFAALALTVLKDRFLFKPSVSDTDTVSVSLGEPVPVPDFKGRSYVDVSSNPVFTKNFRFEEEEVFSDTVAEGYVIEQSIVPDTSVPSGTAIKLTVSKGKEKIVLPNVVGWNAEEAEKKLTEAGFVVEKNETAEGNYADREVIHMAPIADKTYDKGTKIYLSVYSAPTMPPTEPPETRAPETEPETEEDEEETVAETEAQTDEVTEAYAQADEGAENSEE